MPATRKLTREGKPYRTDAARYLDKEYGFKAVRAHVTDAFKVSPGSVLEAVLFGLRQAANLTMHYATVRSRADLAHLDLLARWARQFDLAWKDAKKDAAALNTVAMAPLPAAAKKNPKRRRR